MQLKYLKAVVLAALPILTSCSLLTRDAGLPVKSTKPEAARQFQEAEYQEIIKASRARLKRIDELIQQGKYTEAEEMLAPLKESELLPGEVAELQAKINAGRDRLTTGVTRKQIAIARRLALKDNYDEASAILDSIGEDNACRDEVQSIRQLIVKRRIQEPEKKARKRLAHVERLVEKKEYAVAEAVLDSVATTGQLPLQVAKLRQQIETGRKREVLEVEQSNTVNQVLTEVEEHLVLPKNYGKSVVISANLEPIELPPGPMEELVNKKVTIQLNNAGVSELVQVLADVDGLNIIADDALEAKKNLTLNVREVPLKDVLSYIARNMGVAFHLGENMIWVTESEEEPGGQPLETRIIHLRHGFMPVLKKGGGGNANGGGGAPKAQEDTDLEDSLGAFLANSPEGASYRIFKNRNVLIVRDTIENIRVVEDLVKTFDKPPYQVLIEARFVTIAKDNLFDLGTQITQNPVEDLSSPDNEDSSLEVNNILTELGALTPGSENGLGYMALGGVLGERAFEIVIAALDRDQSSKSLSAPRVTVLNNQTARLRRGDTQYYYDDIETVSADGGDENGTGNNRTAFTGEPKELETGVELNVKVNIGNNGETILLALAPEVSELLRWEVVKVVADADSDSNSSSNSDEDKAGYGEIELPVVSESQIETTVAIKSGETVVLGGLAKNNVDHIVSKVPFLGDIPFIGTFFRHTEEKETPQHLLIFVTAKVIDPAGRFVEVEDGE